MIQEIYKYLVKNWIDITLIVLILISVTIFIVLQNNNSNNNKENDENNTDNIKQHTSIITIQQLEGMTNNDGDKDINNETHKDLLSRMKQGFCSVHSGNSESLEKDCNLLSKDTCNKTQCCIYAYNSENIDGKCVAGSQFGPTYHSDENGINHNFDYYYYMGKKYS